MLNEFEKKIRINELTNLRKELMQQGNVVEEVKVLKELAELTQEVFGEESDENIKILNEIGGTLKYVGEFDTAQNALLKAQGFIEKKYGKNSVPYATCSLNLAEVYRFMKKYEKVEERYHKAIKIYKKNNFQNGYVFSGICNNLGLFYEECKQYQDSIKWQKKSLEILKELENSEIQKAIILSNMVKSYIKLNEKKLAENTMEKALEILQNQVGENSNLYLNILNNLVNVCFENKSYKKTLELLEKYKKIYKSILGTENENYKNILEKIKIVKKEIDKNKMEQYVWKNKAVRKLKN